LLVVCAIIGVLIAMILPAVQSARESARRATCASHLSQLIVGIHQYEQAQLLYSAGHARGEVADRQSAQRKSSQLDRSRLAISRSASALQKRSIKA
jgi:Tfp pilus assembly protein PilE